MYLHFVTGLQRFVTLGPAVGLLSGALWADGRLYMQRGSLWPPHCLSNHLLDVTAGSRLTYHSRGGRRRLRKALCAAMPSIQSSEDSSGFSVRYHGPPIEPLGKL